MIATGLRIRPRNVKNPHRSSKLRQQMPPFDDDSENYLFRDAQERSRRGDTGRNEPNNDSDLLPTR